MTARILDGRALAGEIRVELEARSARLAARTGNRPRLAIVHVGDEGPATVYLGSLARAAQRSGIDVVRVTPEAGIRQDELETRLEALSADSAISGIVVATPLPGPLSIAELAQHIDPRKDVDGIHPLNVGRLARGEPGLVPATALAVMTILRRNEIPVAGRRVVVVGRSPVIGRPAALLLTAADATVTICHSKTRELDAETRRAEILVVAAGRPGLIAPRMVSPGCVVIDCGITATPSGVVGDVDFDGVSHIAEAITPVPGGVGPVTAVMVLSQTVDAAEQMTGGIS